MNNKNSIIKLAISVVMIVFGILILLGQLNIPNVSAKLAEWYLLLILAIISIALICAIVKKAPYWYITAFTLAGLYLALSITIHIKDLSFANLFMVIPMAFGVGIMVAKIICAWKVKAMLIGFLIAISSAFILAGTILEVSEYILPIFGIFVGIILFIFTVKKLIVKKDISSNQDQHVTLSIKDIDSQENEK